MGFIKGIAAHLEPGGEAWLVLSDLALAFCEALTSVAGHLHGMLVRLRKKIRCSIYA